MTKLIELLKQAQALQMKQVANGNWSDIECDLRDDGFQIKGFTVYGKEIEPAEFYLEENDRD